MSDFIDDFHASVHAMADSLELDGEDRDNFVNSAMERKGYRPVTTWELPEDPDDGKGRQSLIPPRKKAAGGKPGQQQPRGKSPYFGGRG